MWPLCDTVVATEGKKIQYWEEMSFSKMNDHSSNSAIIHNSCTKFMYNNQG